MLIGRAPVRGLALLASLPPAGLFLEGAQIVATDPVLWLEALLGSVGKARRITASAAFHLLFSDRLSLEQMRRYASMMTPESPRALADALLRGSCSPLP
jgi:hypothetical protein